MPCWRSWKRCSTRISKALKLVLAKLRSRKNMFPSISENKSRHHHYKFVFYCYALNMTAVKRRIILNETNSSGQFRFFWAFEYIHKLRKNDSSKNHYVFYRDWNIVETQTNIKMLLVFPVTVPSQHEQELDKEFTNRCKLPIRQIVLLIEILFTLFITTAKNS